MSGCAPVRWWVFNGAISHRGAAPPPDTDSRWEVRYDSDYERGKRTTRDPELLAACAPCLPAMRSPASVAYWSQELGYPVTDDPTLHGGGLHVMAPGSGLGIHLDYDLHPLIPGRRRALNLIAFLSPEWRPEWGGALILTTPIGEVVQRIFPAPGRLVAFEVNDLAYHGVEPVTGPVERVTAAAYYLGGAGPGNVRQRAMFLPARRPAAGK